MQQAAPLDGLPLDAFALEEDRLSPAEVDVGRGEVVQALVHAAVVVVPDEGLDLRLELAGQAVVSSRIRFLSVRCQRSIFPCVWGWRGAPRICSKCLSSSHSASSPAM